MRIILLGAPGSGKGTIGPELARHYGATHLSAGELLRAHLEDVTSSGRRIADYVVAGELVPDEEVLDLLIPPISEAAANGGYVLDGFPRNLRQAELGFERAMTIGVNADAVVYLEVPDEVARARLAARAAAGRLDDGNPTVTERRLAVFHSETEPLLEYYQQRGLLVTIDGGGTPEAVTRATIEALDSR